IETEDRRAAFGRPPAAQDTLRVLCLRIDIAGIRRTREQDTLLRRPHAGAAPVKTEWNSVPLCTRDTGVIIRQDHGAAFVVIQQGLRDSFISRPTQSQVTKWKYRIQYHLVVTFRCYRYGYNSFNYGVKQSRRKPGRQKARSKSVKELSEAAAAIGYFDAGNSSPLLPIAGTIHGMFAYDHGQIVAHRPVDERAHLIKALGLKVV